MSKLIFSGGVLLATLASWMGHSGNETKTVSLVSLALRVDRLAEMELFYAEAFGIQFRDVRTGPVVSRFGTLGPVTIKLVPIRDGVDFQDFPVHQPGFAVPDVERVLALAERAGGRLEGEPVMEDGVVIRAAVRDPDGNTVELERVP